MLKCTTEKLPIKPLLNDMPEVKAPDIEPIPAEEDKVFILTDGCMWEKNKQEGTRFPHSIEVVDIETGAVHFIRSGAKIALLDGDITEARSQEEYNKL